MEAELRQLDQPLLPVLAFPGEGRGQGRGQGRVQGPWLYPMRCCSTTSSCSALRMTPRMTSSSLGLRACIFLCFSVWNVCTDQPVWSLGERVEGRAQLGEKSTKPLPCPTSWKPVPSPEQESPLTDTCPHHPHPGLCCLSLPPSPPFLLLFVFHLSKP